MTAWLDEAITPDPEIERKFPGLIKGMLANLSGVHTILLCTVKADAPGVIDALEGVLKAKGINNVTVLTPSTTYRIQRSLYGDRKFVTTIQNVEGRRTDGVFITGVDNGRKQEVEAALKKAEAAVKAHDKALAPLRAALDAAAEEKAARAEHKKSKDRLGRLNILEGRMKTLTQRRDAARAKVQNFDSEAKKAENRDRLGAAHRKVRRPPRQDRRRRRRRRRCAEGLPRGARDARRGVEAARGAQGGEPRGAGGGGRAEAGVGGGEGEPPRR